MRVNVSCSTYTFVFVPNDLYVVIRGCNTVFPGNDTCVNNAEALFSAEGNITPGPEILVNTTRGSVCLCEQDNCNGKPYQDILTWHDKPGKSTITDASNYDTSSEVQAANPESNKNVRSEAHAVSSESKDLMIVVVKLSVIYGISVGLVLL